MGVSEEMVTSLAPKFQSLFPRLNERKQRLAAGGGTVDGATAGSGWWPGRRGCRRSMAEHLAEPQRLGLERGRRDVGGSGQCPPAAANRWPHRLIAVVSRLTHVASSTSLPPVPYSMSNPPGVAT